MIKPDVWFEATEVKLHFFHKSIFGCFRIFNCMSHDVYVSEVDKFYLVEGVIFYGAYNQVRNGLVVSSP